MHDSIYLSMEAIYESFGKEYIYNSIPVLLLQDMEIVIEHESQRAFKIREKDVPRTIIDGVEQLNENTIGGMDIIGWEYHGNHREEIILIVESDSRGN